MFDPFAIPTKYRQNVQIFKPTGSTNLTGLQSWQKPKGVSMVMMLAVSGGGGGGGGTAGAALTLRAGGGGGACSGVSRFICPAFVLPDELYVQVGQGGTGGASGANGTAGTNSLILSSKTNALPNIILASQVNAPGGGLAAGTGGTVPTVAVTQPIHTYGNWASIVGLVGGAGGSGAAGTTITAWAAIPFSPGAGGAGTAAIGTAFAGGAQTATALFDYGNQGYHPAGAGGICAGGVAGAKGNAGKQSTTPFFNSGGSGGGSSDAGAGGDGGNGGIGCGGGGGGAGVTGSAGRGGNGGPGIVIIISW